MPVSSWSTTPASNNSAPPNGWPEGQAASTVNDCARQMMADIRAVYDNTALKDASNIFSLSTNAVYQQTVQNANAGAAAVAGFSGSNGSRTLNLQVTGTGFSGTQLTGGPTGEQAVLYSSGSIPISIGTASTERIRIAGDGTVTYGGLEIGFRGIPQNIQAANYTLVAADAGKHVYHASGAGSGDTYTIPANASVAYTIGTAITFVNNDSNSVSIAVTTDTMTLAGTTTTGTRTLAQNGVATALKVTSTAWLISGTGLS